MEYLEEIKGMVFHYAPYALGALVTLVIGFWLAGLLSRKIRKVMEKRELDASLIPFFSSLISIGIKILVL